MKTQVKFQSIEYSRIEKIYVPRILDLPHKNWIKNLYKNKKKIIRERFAVVRATCVCVHDRGMCILGGQGRVYARRRAWNKSGVRVCVEVSWRWSRGTAPGVAVRWAPRARAVVSAVEAGRCIYSIIRVRCRRFTWRRITPVPSTGADPASG